MIKPVREIMSYWNEGGLILSLCALSGWYGSRYQLGWLPIVISMVLFIAGGVVSWILASAMQGDEYSEDHKVDRFIWLWAAFSWGILIFTKLGDLL